MNQLLGYLLFAFFVAGIAVYIVHSYSKTTAKGTAAHFGLDAGERATQMWIGELDVDISTAERLSTAATGIVAGALLGGIGIATVRAPGVTALLTTHGRLVLVCEQADGTATTIGFRSPHEVAVRHLGDGGRRIQGGRSARFDIAARDGIPLRVLFHESAVPYLSAWRGDAVHAAQ